MTLQKGEIMKKLVFTTLLSALLLTPSLYADNVTDPIDTALESYKDKDYKTAIDELKYAITALQKLDSEVNKQLLPEPLAGWKKSDANSNSNPAMAVFGGGSMTSATYTRGKEKVEIEIIANSPMIASMSMLIANPMLMQSDPNQEPFRYKKAKGMKKKEGKKTEIVLLIGNQILLSLRGRNLQDSTTLDDYLKTMDLKKIQMAFI